MVRIFRRVARRNILRLVVAESLPHKKRPWRWCNDSSFNDETLASSTGLFPNSFPVYEKPVFPPAAARRYGHGRQLKPLVALTQKATLAPDPNNAGLKLPAGFGALVVAETGGHARHLAVTPQGTIYVKLNSPKNGKGILALHPSANGKATVSGGFGSYGGTGMYREGRLPVRVLRRGGVPLQAGCERGGDQPRRSPRKS